MLLVLSRDLSDPAALPAAVVAGGFAAIVALFALLVTETDEAFANTYSAAVSLQNLAPRAPQPLLIALVTVTAVAGALIIDLVSYQNFLLLLGSVFVPLFAVLLADWLAAGMHYSREDVFDGSRLETGARRSLDRGLRALPVALPDRADMVEGPRGEPRPALLGHRRHRAQLPRRVRRRRHRRRPLAALRRGRRARMTEIAVIGNLTLDVVAGAPARPGGGVLLRGRALAHVGADARVAAACAAEDWERLLPVLDAFGLPVIWFESAATTAYTFHYEGERRIMRQDAVADAVVSCEQPSRRSPTRRYVDVGALIAHRLPTGDTRGSRARRSQAARRCPGPRAHAGDSAPSARTPRSGTPCVT